MANRARGIRESFKSYRTSLREQKHTDKQRLRPRLLWNSKAAGTYIRAQHGPLVA